MDRPASDGDVADSSQNLPFLQGLSSSTEHCEVNGSLQRHDVANNFPFRLKAWKEIDSTGYPTPKQDLCTGPSPCRNVTNLLSC